MKRRILSILLAMSFASVPALCVQAEEEGLLDQDIIYGGQDVYSIDFNDGISKEIYTSDDAVMSSWLPEGYSRSVYITRGGGTEEFLYGVSAAPDREDKALKVSTPSTLTGAVSNNYLDIRTAGMNPAFPDAGSTSTGATGYVEFSFDFCTDLNSNMRLSVGRYWCADASEKLSEVNKQDLMYLNTNGTLTFFGTTIKTFDIDEIKNSWHNIKIVLIADNKYQVFFDGEAVNELTDVNYGRGLSFRSIREFRLYNIGAPGVASEKYYDNFRYVVYTDVTDQYEAPVISLGDTYSPIINLEEGESYSVRFVGESVCPKKINIYMDGELAAEYYGSKCEYNYIGTPGEHLVEAELVDTVGNASERIGITFEVAKRIAISGAFNDGEESGEYSDDESRTVNFKAAAEKGLDRVEFYVNGEYAATSNDEETEFSFEEFGSGQLKIIAVVYNAEGDSKEFEYVANVSMERLSVLWSEDYEAYVTGTTKISDHVQIAHKNGYSRAEKIDAEHGTSMALGIEQDLGSDSGEYVNFYNPKGKGHIIFETDFYVSDYPAENAYIRLTMIQESSVQNSNFMLIASDINKGQKKLNYETKVWNHLKLDVDMTSKVYSVFINDVPFVTNISIAKEKPNFESLNYIRFYGPSKDGVPCYIAFDNTKLRAYESYTIISVDSGKGSEEITTSDSEINIYLSEGINPDTLSTDKITIKSGDKKVRIKEVLYNAEEKCITAKLGDVLMGGKEYNIELPDTLETAFGEPLGSGMNTTFTVKSDQRLFLLAAKHNGASMTMSFTSSENIQAYIILSAWDKALCKGEAMVPVSINAGDVVNVEAAVPFADSGDIIEMYAVETLTDFEMLTDDIIRIEKP